MAIAALTADPIFTAVVAAIAAARAGPADTES